ncbi:hypothetical protein GCM10007147_42200 [Nocardiopsis kunsanensis]|uniref:Uncharacterized protein n=1 Tax=Nocardiopsis kunsanensis TaxID=141693 RepID=A0A918XK18_9ACTN|nr:hypothetical protein GCM10007147_42200 [Nocardiopsis kunsanensis]
MRVAPEHEHVSRDLAAVPTGAHVLGEVEGDDVSGRFGGERGIAVALRAQRGPGAFLDGTGIETFGPWYPLRVKATGRRSRS